MGTSLFLDYADKLAWEQMSVARAFNTTAIWILNVGTLKPLELPVEHYMSLAWDLDAWPVNSVDRFLKEWATREFGEKVSEETADIMKKYSVRISSSLQSRKLNTRCTLLGEKRNWLDLIHFRSFNLTSTPNSISIVKLTCRAERVLEEWQSITDRAGKVYDSLDKDTQPAYFELVYMLCLMQTNVHKLYMACK